MLATSVKTLYRFRLAKQQLYTCITLFCTFLCRHCTTTTWKCLISRSAEIVNTRKQLYFSFPELSYSLLEFNSAKNCQHLTNWTRWNKRGKVWSSATVPRAIIPLWLLTVPFKWRFRSRHCRCCLSSLLLKREGNWAELTFAKTNWPITEWHVPMMIPELFAEPNSVQFPSRF